MTHAYVDVDGGFAVVAPVAKQRGYTLWFEPHVIARHHDVIVIGVVTLHGARAAQDLRIGVTLIFETPQATFIGAHNVALDRNIGRGNGIYQFDLCAFESGLGQSGTDPRLFGTGFCFEGLSLGKFTLGYGLAIVG
jgi:hypothetical protein